MTKLDEVVFVSKLGVARKVERSRIWIEGKRLVAHGFTPGKFFSATWEVNKGDPTFLTLKLIGDDDIVNEAPRKVSGKGAKPIIDITGADVLEHFGKFGHVTVVFVNGLISIRGVKVAK